MVAPGYAARTASLTLAAASSETWSPWSPYRQPGQPWSESVLPVDDAAASTEEPPPPPPVAALALSVPARIAPARSPAPTSVLEAIHPRRRLAGGSSCHPVCCSDWSIAGLPRIAWHRGWRGSCVTHQSGERVASHSQPTAKRRGSSRGTWPGRGRRGRSRTAAGWPTGSQQAAQPLADQDDADDQQQGAHHSRVVHGQPAVQRLQRPGHPLAAHRVAEHGHRDGARRDDREDDDGPGLLAAGQTAPGDRR